MYFIPLEFWVAITPLILAPESLRGFQAPNTMILCPFVICHLFLVLCSLFFVLCTSLLCCLLAPPLSQTGPVDDEGSPSMCGSTCIFYVPLSMCILCITFGHCQLSIGVPKNIALCCYVGRRHTFFVISTISSRTLEQSICLSSMSSVCHQLS